MAAFPLSVFDSAPVGVMVTAGPDHRLIYSNHAHQQIVGARPIGAPIREAFHDLRQEGYFALLDQVLTTGESVILREMPFELGDYDPLGRERFSTVSMSKISLGDEEGLMIVIVDVTAQVESAADTEGEGRRRFLQRYQSLIQLESQGVWVTGQAGEVIEPSLGWQRLTGQSWEEHRGNGWLDAVHPDDRERAAEQWARAVERLERLEQEFRVKTKEGPYRHIRVRAAPVVEGREVIEWVGTITDVEHEWREERHRELLDRAAAVTADLAGLDEVLAALVDVIVPTVSDGCGIYVLPEFEDESIPTPFVAERLVSIVREGDRPPQPGPQPFDHDCDFVTAIRTRRPVHRVFSPGQAPPGAVPPGAEAWFEAARGNSLALVPVVVDGVVAAVVHAAVCGDREPLGEAEVDLLGRMLDHAHAHLSNAMRFQRTQRIALALQNYLLPDPPEVPGLEITARYRPSATAAEIGGDWYDSFRLPDGSTVLTVGDVAGHDLAAAVTMSQLRNMLRGLAMDRREPPGDILRRLNIATESLYPDGTATCVLARLGGPLGGGRRLEYAVAGHPPPLLVTSGGEARYLDDGLSPLLGVTGDMPRDSAVVTLPPHSTLLLYTDGLVEVPGEHLDEGLERLRRCGACLADTPLGEFCDNLLTRLSMARTDDIAMIAVRLPGSAAVSAG
ncbi:SpoIIE family protein phosphatase [Nonomuraea aridisoli]|uniref:SpoIIE family protein phosphatase n=1 Tax=Nonomuraea aridisoli TaxID=2070368 RepID=UPI001F3ABEE0|nr:SpoIIE family protein phosphatase [Nonomuraea aridisoli]